VTVEHGDFRIDNLLFDDSAVPADRVAMLDWQISGSGPGVFDAAYLLSGSMAVDDRRACERDVVRAWHEALGRSDYFLESAWTEYRRNLLVTTVYAVIAGAQFDPATERGRELVEGMAIRSFTACLDLTAADLL
jgi:aminoglycoside phosphotransferase (APT) family kinase protein